MPLDAPQALLSPDEVARVLGVSRKTVYKLTNRGLIGSLRVGGLLRFSESDLRAFLQHARREDTGWEQPRA